MSAKKKHRASNGNGRRKVHNVVFQRDDVCWLCWEPVDKSLPKGRRDSPELDEDEPFSKGGSATDPANVNLVHRACNQLKGNRKLPSGAFAGDSPAFGGSGNGAASRARPAAEVRTSIDWKAALGSG